MPSTGSSAQTEEAMLTVIGKSFSLPSLHSNEGGREREREREREGESANPAMMP